MPTGGSLVGLAAPTGGTRAGHSGNVRIPHTLRWRCYHALWVVGGCRGLRRQARSRGPRGRQCVRSTTSAQGRVRCTATCSGSGSWAPRATFRAGDGRAPTRREIGRRGACRATYKTPASLTAGCRSDRGTASWVATRRARYSQSSQGTQGDLKHGCRAGDLQDSGVVERELQVDSQGGVMGCDLQGGAMGRAASWAATCRAPYRPAVSCWAARRASTRRPT